MGKITSTTAKAVFSASIVGVRDRRYTMRYPFAANAELVDLESGKQVDGVTSDISHGGCFVCTKQLLPIRSRARMKLVRKGKTFEALVFVRIVKPRIGMGIEFFDLDAANVAQLARWIDSFRGDR
jgi:PilZ domain